jgi:hypothetical protein
MSGEQAMKHIRTYIAAAGIACFFAGSAIAHHSLSEFDPDLPISISGTVSKVEWKSPHARLYLDAVGEDGETVNWNFELPSPNTLMRRGWNRNALQPGEQVTVTGIRARNYPTIAIARTITNKDGEAFFSGSADPLY